MWVIFEGLDKTGKTTLQWDFMKATNFKHVTIDRGPMGYMSYDKILDRSTKAGDREFIDMARKVVNKKTGFIVVLCEAPEDVVMKRLEEHNEEPLACNYSYKQCQTIYRKNVLRYYDQYKVIILDTSKLSREECVEAIIKKLKEFKKM